MENVKQLLASKGVQPSYHRIRIYDFLRRSKSHPTAEDIYNALSGDIPTLSKTTVYNTLKLLKEKGLVVELLIDNEARYDANVAPHAHFKCKVCGRVFDLETLRCPSFELEEIEGHIVCERHLYLVGICRDCRKKGAVP